MMKSSMMRLQAFYITVRSSVVVEFTLPAGKYLLCAWSRTLSNEIHLGVNGRWGLHEHAVERVSILQLERPLCAVTSTTFCFVRGEARATPAEFNLVAATGYHDEGSLISAIYKAVLHQITLYAK